MKFKPGDVYEIYNGLGDGLCTAIYVGRIQKSTLAEMGSQARRNNGLDDLCHITR